jgi:hypothetical protein
MNNTQQQGVLAQYVEALRTAYRNAKDAVHAWRETDRDGRALVAGAMLRLLTESEDDVQGDETLDAVSDFLVEHDIALLRFARLGDQTSRELLDAIQHLGTQATKLDCLRSLDASLAAEDDA